MSHKLYASKGLILYDEVQRLIGESGLSDINWIKQETGLPTTGTNLTLRTIKFANNIWMTGGDYGSLLTSSNGTDWVDRTDVLGFGSSSITDISFGNNRWFVTAYNGRAAYSDNNGVTWNIVNPGFGSIDNTIRSVVYAYYNSQHRWIMVGGGNNSEKISMSIDNGINWSLQSVPSLSDGYLTGIDFDGTSTLIISIDPGGSDYHLLRSTNGGDSWIAFNTDIWSKKAYNIKYENGIWMACGTYISGTGAFTWTSSDGINWASNTVENPSTGILYDISYTNFNNEWISVSSSGKIYKSTDNGANWSLIIKSQTGCNSIDANSSIMRIASTGGYILKSSDNGNNWTPIFSKYSAIRQIIHDGSKWVAMGNMGLVLYSNDGKNWTEQNISIASNTSTSFDYNGSNTYISKYSNTELTSSPDLINWTIHDLSAITDGLNKIKYGGNVWIVHSNDNSGTDKLVSSSNDGTTWIEINLSGILTSGDDITDFNYNGSNLWMMLYEGQIATSSDGIIWSTSGLTNPNFDFLTGQFKLKFENGMWFIFQFTNPDIYIFTSNDNGATWLKYNSTLSFSSNNYAGTIWFKDIQYNNSIWLMVLSDDYGYISEYLTSNDGINWNSAIKFPDSIFVGLDWTQYIYSIAYDFTNNFWLTSGHGNIIASSKII